MVVVILSSGHLVIGGTSRGPSTAIDRGETVIDDDHWAEIMDRYRDGLAPYFASGQLSVRHEIDLPDEPEPAERQVLDDEPVMVDSAPSPSLDGVSIREAAPLIATETDGDTLLAWLDDSRITIRRLVEARLDELTRRER